jgi:aldose 1-epimerase
VNVTRRLFGVLPDGRRVDQYVLAAATVEVSAITLGGIITAIRTPGRDGQRANIVLAHDTLEGYFEHHWYFGAIAGRYANRIAHGHVELFGRPYQLTRNDGPHHLHGGRVGFDQHLWSAVATESADVAAVEFSRRSSDGEEGYPGELDAVVRYELHRSGALTLRYRAVTDAPTIVNLTQHTYFNLSTADDDVLGHELTIAADQYTPVDAELIPTGELANVAGTPFDFRVPMPVGARIDGAHPQLRHGQGYDHNYVLRAGGATTIASLFAPSTGRTLEVSTSEPGLQFYSGNMLDGDVAAADGRIIRRRVGLCLETQHFPDSPHHPAFPSTVLLPGETYSSTTRWQFGYR